jgi:hypothetical protein
MPRRETTESHSAAGAGNVNSAMPATLATSHRAQTSGPSLPPKTHPRRFRRAPFPDLRRAAVQRPVPRPECAPRSASSSKRPRNSPARRRARLQKCCTEGPRLWLVSPITRRRDPLVTVETGIAVGGRRNRRSRLSGPNDKHHHAQNCRRSPEVMPQHARSTAVQCWRRQKADTPRSDQAPALSFARQLVMKPWAVPAVRLRRRRPARSVATTAAVKPR